MAVGAQRNSSSNSALSRVSIQCNERNAIKVRNEYNGRSATAELTNMSPNLFLSFYCQSRWASYTKYAGTERVTVRIEAVSIFLPLHPDGAEIAGGYK